MACSSSGNGPIDSEDLESDESEVDDGGSESSEFLPPEIERRYLAMNILEGGVDRILIKGSSVVLEFDLGNRVWALGFCSRMEGTWQIIEKKFAFTMLRFIDVDENCPVAKKQQDEWYFNFVLSSPTMTGDNYVFWLDNGFIQMEFFRTYGEE